MACCKYIRNLAKKNKQTEKM